MVIVYITGGLGNQLFQYAAGRALAVRQGSELKLDISGFEKYKLHDYSLDAFNIIENLAKAADVEPLIEKKKKGVKRKISFLKKMLSSGHGTHIKDDNAYEFKPYILNLKGDVYLDGYWQSEKYFKDVQDIIRKDLTVKEKIDGKNKEVADEIKNSQSVSLHIRRGDYITDEKTRALFDVCTMDYYGEAIRKITEKEGNVKLFIFSNDIDWVKENLKTDREMYFVDHNKAGKNYEDLRLMSLCKNNIIANSSFSWWGAWLNENENKTVICPKIWIRSKKKKVKDILSDQWVKI